MISKKITIIDVIIGILELEKNTQLTVKELKEEFEKHLPDGEPNKDKWLSKTIFDLPANLKRMEDAEILDINRPVDSDFDFWRLKLKDDWKLKISVNVNLPGKIGKIKINTEN